MIPSAHVLDLFAVPAAVEPLSGKGSVVAGDLVLSPDRDPAVAEWLSPVLARLAVRMDERPGRRRRDLRIAVPVPARDGSWVVEGWAASRFEPGAVPCADLDVLLATAGALHAEFAVAVPECPPVLNRRDDRRARAERLAFDGPPRDNPLLVRVAEHLDGTGLGPDQLVHANLQGNVLLDAAGAPVVIDVAPAWRPALWAEAVCLLDWVAAGDADAAACWADDAARRQAMLRAVAFRLLGDPPGAASHWDAVLSSLDA